MILKNPWTSVLNLGDKSNRKEKRYFGEIVHVMPPNSLCYVSNVIELKVNNSTHGVLFVILRLMKVLSN